MSAIYQAESGSVEVVPVIVTTVSDPTGGDAPEFAFVSGDGNPSTWTAGTWGTWTAGTSSAVALSPTLPSDAATVELAEGRWTVYVRFDVGAETVVEAVGTLVVG